MLGRNLGGAALEDVQSFLKERPGFSQLVSSADNVFASFASSEDAEQAIRDSEALRGWQAERSHRELYVEPERSSSPQRAIVKQERCKGTVRSWLEGGKKHGWIVPDQQHDGLIQRHGNLFVSHREAPASLAVGDRVTYLLYSDSDGLGASDVRLDEAA